MKSDLVTDDGKLKLTQKELVYLKAFLDAGDRGGFYMAYYNMTGDDGIIVPGQVSTFSSNIGGTAYLANALLHEAFRDNEPGDGQYLGIYALSHRVADSIFAAISANVKNGGSGFITGGEILSASTAAWEAAGQRFQFPGLPADDLVNDVFTLTNFDFSLDNIIRIFEGVVDTIEQLAESNNLNDESLIQTLLSTGTLAAIVGALGSDVFAKRRSDYQTVSGAPLEGYRFETTPDQNFDAVIRKSDGKTVAMFDNRLPFESFVTLTDRLVDIGNNFAIDLLFRVRGLGDVIEFFSGFLGRFRRSLSEVGDRVTFDGDINPNFTTTEDRLNRDLEPFKPSPWSPEVGGTSGADTLWETAHRTTT